MLGNIINIKNYPSVRVRDGGGMGFSAVRMGGCEGQFTDFFFVHLP